MKNCFDEKDISNAVYLYPSCCLHVTIASPYPFTVQPPNEADKEKHIHLWKDVFIQASNHDLWPSDKIQLKLSHTQIGKKAGILLWEEDSGDRIELIRKCIQIVTDSKADEATKLGINLKALSIPPIIHSTFLRFLNEPSFSTGESIQEKFQRNIVSCLDKYFTDGITLDSVKFVYERTPYMHIPNDDSHVLHEIKLD